MLEWLENWLRNYPGAVLVVSHDRAFLEHVPDAILELDAVTHQIKQYNGVYSDYLRQRGTEHARQMQAYSDQQVEITQLKQAAAHLRGIARFKKGGKADTGDKLPVDSSPIAARLQWAVPSRSKPRSISS